MTDDLSGMLTEHLQAESARFRAEQRAAIAKDIANNPRRCDGCGKINDMVSAYVIQGQRFKFCPTCHVGEPHD